MDDTYDSRDLWALSSSDYDFTLYMDSLNVSKAESIKMAKKLIPVYDKIIEIAKCEFTKNPQLN